MRIVVVLLAMILGMTVGGYAMIETLSLEDLTASAEVVAVATLVKADQAGEEKGFKKVSNTLEIGEVLKGGLAKGEKITIRTLAGFEDEPVFEPRIRYLLFLQKNADGAYATVNLVQGAWPISPDGKFLGMGTGTGREALEKAIKATLGRKPSEKPSGQPASGSGDSLL